MLEITVIDYGLGNLFSVRRGLEHCGANVTITADPETILAAPRVVLPGVGAFGNAMDELRRLDLVDVVRAVASSGRPLLGICLGMQLLLDESEEFGIHEGLGIIPGRVVPVPSTTITGEPQKIPHIGWNALYPADGGTPWQGTIMGSFESGAAVYFVHSFMAEPLDPAHRFADCIYGGQPIAGVISTGNVVGCQFHPEKSGEVGLGILQAFCNL